MAGLKTIVIPVADLTAAKTVYAHVLGVEPTMDAPYYVGYDLGGLHVGLAPRRDEVGTVGYWEVDDIEATRDALLAAGATERQPVQNVGGGRRLAVLADPDGNSIGILSDPH